MIGCLHCCCLELYAEEISDESVLSDVHPCTDNASKAQVCHLECVHLPSLALLILGLLVKATIGRC